MTLVDRRTQALGAGAPLFYREPIHLVRGDGVEVFDDEGRRYLDVYNNVPCVGHANPAVAQAMFDQQATLNVHSRYLHDGIVTLAERMVDMHPPQIESVVFGCSGTEAVEVAINMARLATGRRGIIGTSATYHGNSDTVIQLRSARGDGDDPTRPRRYPEVRLIPFPDSLRPLPVSGDGDDPAAPYLAALDDAIADLQTSGPGVAAIVLCSILANEGLPDIPDGFMARAAEQVRAAGGLVIADEVQAGYCRSGNWWGYTTSGFEPDIVVTGKPMGNGLPVSGAAASRDLVDRFRSATRYFNTFASSPLQAAVGNAVLDEIDRMGLEASVAEVGAGLKGDLAERRAHADWIGDVRGCGLFIGVEMVRDSDGLEPDVERAVEVVNRLKDKGILASNAGAYANVLKIRPPLVFGADHAAEFVAAFDAVVADIEAGR